MGEKLSGRATVVAALACNSTIGVLPGDSDAVGDSAGLGDGPAPGDGGTPCVSDVYTDFYCDTY